MKEEVERHTRDGSMGKNVETNRTFAGRETFPKKKDDKLSLGNLRERII